MFPEHWRPRDVGCGMHYAPRFAPEKPGMPLLGYFAGVGAVLLGLLFAADAYMPRVEHLSFVSNVEGLPAAYKGKPARVPPAAAHIAPGVAETTGSSSRSSGSALAPEAPKTLPTVAAARPFKHPAVKPVKRKMMVGKQPHREVPVGSFRQHDFAHQDYGRHDFRFSSRDREPSWRDSWAAGSFQGEPRPRGNAWSSGSGFGYFR